MGRPRKNPIIKKSHHKKINPQSENPKSGSLTSSSEAKGARDPVETIFRETDASIGAAAETAAGTQPAIETGALPEAFDTQAFLTTGVSQLVAQVVILSKVVGGWSSPAIPGPDGTFLLSEADWQAAVSATSVAVINKRWPSLADKVTPEFALLALVTPWVLSNMAPMLLSKVIPAVKGFFGGKRERPTPRDSDSRRDRDRENVSDAETSESVPESVFA